MPSGVAFPSIELFGASFLLVSHEGIRQLEELWAKFIEVFEVV